MTAEFDSFTNRGEYFTAHYFAEGLPADLAKGLLSTWTLCEGDEHHHAPTPRQQVRALRGEYLRPEVRTFLAESAARSAEAEHEADLHTYAAPAWTKTLIAWHRHVLTALGFPAVPDAPIELTVPMAGREVVVPVAWHGEGIVALDCGWATLADAVLDGAGPGRLLHPVRVSASESYPTGAALASRLFASTPTRFVVLLCGGVLLLADRHVWGEGRFLAANLDVALERNDRRQQGELATIAALFSHEMLAPASDGKGPLLDTLLKASTENATGVTGELREGLQRCVEIVANEVLARLDQAGIEAAELEGPRLRFADELARETLRYLYRILFLLYAEARPELRILPADDGSYEAGYSVARLRDLVERDEQLVDEEARTGFHLYESLDLLFRMVNSGHRPHGTEDTDDRSEDTPEIRAAKRERRSEDRGLRFEPLRSELFEPGAIRLIGAAVAVDDDRPPVDTRLRNDALHQVLRLLTKKKGARRGARGGFISYRNLGIIQLGAVYEGLMSYTGVLAEEELCEVTKRNKPEMGSWLVPARRQTEYADALVEYDEYDEQRGRRGPKRYSRGAFVYRMAGRDRETSASYYTPESLTKVTVELALRHRLDQDTDEHGRAVLTKAAELLQWTICEPALGSGAFLNEAINQVAEEYLRRRQDELGVSVPTADALLEKQRVKAHIALHNAYGIDLNATGVELADISLWLNTMHAGMRAPWFGLHLRRGNSLIGARRAVYAGTDVKSTAWSRAKDQLAPTPLPFPEPLLDGMVHQFLLPNPGWAAVAGSKEAKELDPEPAARLGAWRKGLLRKPTDRQYVRLRDAARRAEYLWTLVTTRMKISERAIARHIPIWGADPTEPEFQFLERPRDAVSKEQVYTDLFDAPDSPYRRLRIVMDAWCALWFWPVGAVDLLDGTHPEYAHTAEPPGLDVLLGATPAVAEPTTFFTMRGEQLSFDDAEPVPPTTTDKKKGPAKPRRPRRTCVPLVNLDDWLDFLEAMLGTTDVPADSLIDQFDSLAELSRYEDLLPFWTGMDTGEHEERFPWLHQVREIAERQGFLHWELEFARVFQDRQGFDLQVGNPPWVRPRWDENAVLAEFDPWFELADKPPIAAKDRRRAEVLAVGRAMAYVLDERTSISAQVAFFGSPQTYPLLVGTQPDLYRAFMIQTWAHARPVGTIGLVHPDTHFTGDKEGALRAAAYHRLGVHGDFVNAGQRFFPEPVGHTAHFGVHIYGQPGEIAFQHLSWLVSADALRHSADHDGAGEVPGIRYRNAEFDERPHSTRVVEVTPELLRVWQRLLNEEGKPVDEARLLSPVSTAEVGAIEALATYPLRLEQFDPHISDGYHESGAKNRSLIEYNQIDSTTGVEYQPPTWRRVILKPPQISNSTPAFKRYNANSNDPYGADLVYLPSNFVPDTEYVRAAGRTKQFLKEQDFWDDRDTLNRLQRDPRAIELAHKVIIAASPGLDDENLFRGIDAVLRFRSRRRETTFHRLAWRRQIVTNTERALYGAIVPPGTTHVDRVHSLAMDTQRHTALVTGFWSALPLDYFLRVTGRGDLRFSDARAMPAPQEDHPLASALLLRTLRLNCLTTAYARLWRQLHNPAWPSHERWAIEWPGLPPLHEVTPEWQRDTPLRTERARRSALVEIDALVAVWLGMSADALIAAYRGRFPVLQKYEAVTYFDAEGWKIAGNARTIGQRQQKGQWTELQAYLQAPRVVAPPQGYTPPFHKADREGEMRAAHAVFQDRLDAAVDRGEWDPEKQEVPVR